MVNGVSASRPLRERYRRNMFWGLVLIAIGALFIYWARTESDFVLYRLFVARSRGLWGSLARVHTFHQVSGVLMILMGCYLALRR